MQRNGQNPIRAVKFGDNQGIKTNDGITPQGKSNAGTCPKCGAEVPPKPGFRFSSLKCPKCGSSMGKK